MKALVLLLALAACAAPARAPTLDDRLRALAVGDDDFYRPVLYTWTTPAAIADLRSTRRLLVATASTGGFTSPFNRSLAALAAHGTGDGAAIARLLTTDPRLVHRRYAWPAPFATVMGLGARGYGNALVRIELRPEAWIARFDPGRAEPFSVVDARGATVAPADVLADPSRLAAVFHVRVERGIGVRFREYVVVNPDMVASWSIATPAIRAELDDEIALLSALAPRFADLPRGAARIPAAAAWAHARASDLLARWHAALAFDNPRYLADPRALAAIVDALDAYDPAGPPLTVRP